MIRESGCPLPEDGESRSIPDRCIPCVRSALRLKGTTVATHSYEYEQEDYPYYAEHVILEWLVASGERRRHITEHRVVNPDTDEVIQVESREYVSYKCPRL